MNATVHHLSITLEHVKPKVQREFVVPSKLRLDRLHSVIQVVMGWTDSHLHEFIVGGLRDGERYGLPDPQSAGFGSPTRKETGYTLEQIAPAKGSSFRYVYDFGDDWMHLVKVKAIVPVEVAGDDIPFCVKARGACPPEDCGGPWGYANLLSILADPAHDEHADMRDWIGDHFDPGFCEVDEINQVLAAVAANWRPAAGRGQRTGASAKAATRSSAKPASKSALGSATKTSPPDAAAPLLVLDPSSAAAFIGTYKALLLGIAGEPDDDADFATHLGHARRLIPQDPVRLAGAIDRLRAAGQTLDSDALEAIAGLRLQRWIYLRDTRSYSLFLAPDGQAAYGVVGLTERIRDVVPGGSGAIIETALLTYRGRVVCDNLIVVHGHLGSGARRSANEMLARLRATDRYSNERLFPTLPAMHAAPAADPPGDVPPPDCDRAPVRGDSLSEADQASSPRNRKTAPASAQADLFAPAPSSVAAPPLVVITVPAATVTREQRSFNRLTDQIRRKREELADWQRWLSAFTDRMAGEYEPLQRQHYQAEVGLVRGLDAVLESTARSRLRRPERELLRRYLKERLHELLNGPGEAEAELAALLRKHTGEDIDALREEEQRFEREVAETILGGMFGEDVLEGHQAEDVESLLRHAQERMHARQAEQAQTEQATAAGRQRARRAQAAADRRAQAEREASQTVREIFRKLASSLHPDREADPAQRERKTELMQQLTRAYQTNDLLQLLTLQLQIAQIDDAHLAGLPDARLRHYNAVLREQLTSLDREIVELAQSVAMQLQAPDPMPRRPHLERELGRRIAERQRWIADAQDETAALADEQGRRRMIAHIAARFEAEDAVDNHDLDILFGMAAGFPPGFDPRHSGSAAAPGKTVGRTPGSGRKAAKKPARGKSKKNPPG